VIIDLGIDAFFPILEEIGEKIETLEEKIISESPEKIPPNIHSLKLEILAVRRSVWPMRDSINSLCRDVSPYIGENTRFYFPIATIIFLE